MRLMPVATPEVGRRTIRDTVSATSHLRRWLATRGRVVLAPQRGHTYRVGVPGVSPVSLVPSLAGFGEALGGVPAAGEFGGEAGDAGASAGGGGSHGAGEGIGVAPGRS